MAETVFVAKTGILDTEWVLRSLYSVSPLAIVQALSASVALPQVRCEYATSVLADASKA